MAGRKTAITGIVSSYVKALQEQMTVKKVYLFGSRARGSARPDSDIDLAVISADAGSSKRLYDVMAWASLAALRVDPNIEPVIMTPQEIAKPEKGSLAEEVLKTGILVYSG